MPPNNKKLEAGSCWQECESCGSKITLKDAAVHSTDCPPNPKQLSHYFVRDGALFGAVDLKANEEIKGLSQHEKDNLVFLSQAGIQLCGLSIGEPAVIEDLKTSRKVIRTVWPTIEKTLFSILFTKNGLEISGLQPTAPAKVTKITTNVYEAVKLTLTMLNRPKSLNLSNELLNRLQKSHLDRLVVSGNVLAVLFYGKLLKFKVVSVEVGAVCLEYGGKQNRNLADEFAEISIGDKEVGDRAQDGQDQIVRITQKTSFVFFKDESEYKSQTIRLNPFAKIGGLAAETSELLDLMACALGRKPGISGFSTTRCVLLTGSSGTGKTLLANAVAQTAKTCVVQVNSSELYGRLSGSPEDNVAELFRTARDKCPSVVVVDEVEALCPARGSRLTESEKKVAGQLMTELDELVQTELPVFVLGTSSRPDAVDSAVRRSGRFEREIEIPVPNPKSRLDILSKLLPKVDTEMLKDVSKKTHGYVGADLVALSARTALHASQANKTSVDWEDFKFALTKVRPSAMREVQIECPNVLWKDIGGQEKLKLILRQCVEWPLFHGSAFTRMGITPPRGVLMYGPPGCSKTMIAKALATESGLNFLSIKGPELFSKWVGESERAVREVIRKARQVAPSIVFFDEIDALCGERGGTNSVQERVLAQLLTELDGVTPLGDVTVLAATNRPDRIDNALLRPGRLDRLVYVPLPNYETRMEIFKIKLAKMPVGEDVDIVELANASMGYSGAEVNAVCHEAAMMALEEDMEAAVVYIWHFREALRLVQPRTPVSLLDMYEQYNKNK